MNAKQALINTNFSNQNNFKRVKIVYGIAVLETILLIIFIFAQSIKIRLTQGIWERAYIPMKWTLSLDFHAATTGFLCLLLITQVIMGFIQKPNNYANKFHVILGNIILFFMIVFLLVGIWNIRVRYISPLLKAVFYFATVVVSVYFARGYIAIKQKNVLKHLDSMVGLIIFIGVAAMIRLVYLSTFFYYHGSIPFTDAFIVLLASLILFAKLAMYYALAGRLRQNIVLVTILLILFAIIYCIYPWDIYGLPLGAPTHTGKSA